MPFVHWKQVCTVVQQGEKVSNAQGSICSTLESYVHMYQDVAWGVSEWERDIERKVKKNTI